MASGLSITEVAALEPRPYPYIQRHRTIPCFGARVYPSGVKTWVVRVTVGKRTRLYSIGPCGAIRLDRAELEAGEILLKTKRGQDPFDQRRQSDATVGDLLRAFVDGADHLSDGTHTQYGSVASRLPKTFLRLGLRDVTPRDCKLASQRFDRPSIKTQFKSVMMGAWKWAFEQDRFDLWDDAGEFMLRCPAEILKTYSSGKRNQTYDAESLGRLWRHMETTNTPHPLDAAIKLQILTGARVHEILSLRSDEMQNKPIPHFLKHSHKTSSRTGEARPIILSRHALELWTLLGLTNGIAHKTGYAFACDNRRGYPETSTLNRRLQTLCKQTGVEYGSSHVIRHTFVSIAEALGIPRERRARLVGHAVKDGLQMQNTYSHVTKELLAQLREDADRIGDFIIAAGSRESE